MPRRYVKKNLRVKYDRDTLRTALVEVQTGHTLRDVEARYGIPKSTLAKYKNVYDVDALNVGGGRKTRLTKEDEASLSKYLYECGKYGYGFTKVEVLRFVQEFCEDTGNVWSEAGPGREWYEGFMRRHPELSIRKGESMSSQRLRGADPFVIQRWYKQLEDVYKKEKISLLDGHLIYNCDETAFSHDPKDVRLIAPRGQKRVSKNIAGSGKKNTTVLACGNAAGQRLPPFIIFKGKYVWQNWIPNEDYPGTVYTAQKKGWMDGDLFYKWFKDVFLPFVKPLEERGGRKVILIYDGAAVHTSYRLSKSAVDNGVILIKLPANVTHYMQPLDKCVFKPVKTMWNNEMLNFNRDFPGRILPNDQFSLKLKIIWEKAFKSEHLTSGFRSTGLFPVNFSKFPEEAYDVVKLKRFKTCSNSIDNQKLPHVENSEQPQPGPSRSISYHTEVAVADCSSRDPLNGPEHSQEKGSRFEEFIRLKLTENLTKKTPTTKTRKRISDSVGDIMTSSIALKKLKEKDDQSKSRKSTLQKSKQRQAKRVISSSSSESETEVVLESEFEYEDLDKSVEMEDLCNDVSQPISNSSSSINIRDIVPGCFVTVEFVYNSNSRKETVKEFVAQILEVKNNGEFKVNCMRSYKGKNNSFIFPQVPDESVIGFLQIKSVLSTPKIYRGYHVFKEFAQNR